MASHTIKLSGVSDELLRLLDERVRAEQATGRSEYILDLIRQDVLSQANGRPSPRTFREIVAPVHAAAPPEETEEETERFVDDLIGTVRRERRKRTRPRVGTIA